MKKIRVGPLSKVTAKTCMFGTGSCAFKGFERCKNCSDLHVCNCPKDGFGLVKKEFLKRRSQVAFFIRRERAMAKTLDRFGGR